MFCGRIIWVNLLIQVTIVHIRILIPAGCLGYDGILGCLTLSGRGRARAEAAGGRATEVMAAMSEDQGGAQVTWGAKVPADLKDELSRYLQETGMMPRDFLRFALGEARVKVPPGSDPQFATELARFRGHLARAEEIFLSALAAIRDRAEAEHEKVNRLEAALADAGTRAERAAAEAAAAGEALGKANEARERAERLVDLAQRAAADAENRARGMREAADRAEEYREATVRERERAGQLQAALLEATKRADAEAEALARIGAELDRERALREDMERVASVAARAAEAAEARAEEFRKRAEQAENALAELRRAAVERSIE